MLLIRKIFYIFVILSLSFNLFTPLAHAQSAYAPNPYIIPQTNSNVPQNMHTLVQSLVIESLSSVYCLLSGIDVLSANHQCLGIDPTTNRIGYEKAQGGGLVGFSWRMIGSLYTPPASAQNYISYLSQHFKFLGAGKAYAADSVGQITLNPLLGIWVGFRNISYFLLVLAFIILGVLIMLRVKIDPRTVMTLQNQIPKVIIGIILITFSFAIAGLLIDLMYVITFIGLSILGNIVNNPAIGASPIESKTILEFIPEGIGALSNNVGQAAGNSVNSIIAGANIPFVSGLNELLGVIALCSFHDWVNWIPAPPYCMSQGGIVGFLAYLIIGIVAFFAILVACFKVWFGLLKAYITILFYIVLGPIVILMGVVPGLKMGFGMWMRTLIANLVLFPAILFFIILGTEIGDAINNAKNYFVPPLVGSLTTYRFGSIISFAVVMIAPKLIDEIPKMLKAQGGLGDAVMGGFQGGQALAGQTVGRGMKRAFRAPDPYRQLDEGWGRRMMLGRPQVGNDGKLIRTGAANWRRRAFYAVTGYNPDKVAPAPQAPKPKP